MALTILDTDVIIDYLRNAQPGAGRVARAIRESEVATTAISAFELLSGVRNEVEEAEMYDLLAKLPVLPFDAEAAERASAVNRTLRSRGTSLASADTLIAGIALAQGGLLLTRNLRHFQRIDGLWVESA